MRKRELIKKGYDMVVASLTGHAANVTGAAWTVATNQAGDGLAHQVTIRNDAATDHSGKTIALTGTDANGNAQTETVTGPEGSATVTSTKFFLKLLTATPSATIGADTMDIGWLAAGVSPWFEMPWLQSPLDPVAVAAHIANTIDFDIEHTYDDMNADAVAFKNASATGKTADVEVVYTAPPRAVRVNVNSHTDGEVTLYVL